MTKEDPLNKLIKPHSKKTRKNIPKIIYFAKTLLSLRKERVEDKDTRDWKSFHGRSPTTPTTMSIATHLFHSNTLFKLLRVFNKVSFFAQS